MIPLRKQFRCRGERKAERRTRLEVRTGLEKVLLDEIGIEISEQHASNLVGVTPPFVRAGKYGQIGSGETAVSHTLDQPLEQVGPAWILDAERQMERRFVHRHGNVIAASRNIQKVTWLQHLIECRTGRGYRRARELAAIHAFDRESIEQPPLPAIELKDEDLLIVAMEVKAVHRTPPGVDVDLGPPSKETLEALGKVRERTVHFVNGVERQRRATTKMSGHVFRADPRRKAFEIRIRRGFEIASLQRQPETKGLAPVLFENSVQLRPREKGGKSIRSSSAQQMLPEPVVRQELVHRHRRQQRGQPGPGIASRIRHRTGAAGK